MTLSLKGGGEGRKAAKFVADTYKSDEARFNHEEIVNIYGRQG